MVTGKGIFMRRVVLFVMALSTLLAMGPAAGASKPAREEVPAPGDMVFTGQCGFPVLGHIAGGEIDTTFFNNDGDPVKQIAVFPGQTLTLTNLASGEAITVVNSGSTQLRAKPGGALEITIMGHGPIQNEIVGEPGLWYLDGGQVTVNLDAAGNPTSIRVLGNVVNLCERLG
jgi:hypothetical protein